MELKQDHDSKTLWVCWTRPETPPGPEAAVLSFLSPAAEDECERAWPGRFLRAREASLRVRPQAKRLYVDLAAGIGTLRDESGRTLREALAQPDRASRWWYHPVSFKDCEASPLFSRIIAVLTIQRVAADEGISRLVLVSAPWEVAAVLKGAYAVEELKRTSRPSVLLVWLKGMGSRLRYVKNALTLIRAARLLDPASPARRFDVALTGFWDWSVRGDSETGGLTDRYFKRLPEELRAAGAGTVGWLVWLDPGREPGLENRPLQEVMAALRGRENVVILQAFLRPSEVFARVADLRPLLTFLRFRRAADWREVFNVDGWNYAPIFADPLLRGFVDCSLACYEGVALATERAARRLQPKVSFIFLEHFLWSRAHYEGLRRAETGTRAVAVQHASYNSEKTFLSLHPELEFRGAPDGCPVPHPEAACVMGSLGGRLFGECGYPSDQVFVTGSPRYDGAVVYGEDRPVQRDAGPRTILLALSLQTEVEIDMVEAVYRAAEGLSGLVLVARNHPFSRIERHPRFGTVSGAVRVSGATLEDDLRSADLVLYTYSTVAEEAFLRGIPAWQWLPLDFNGSALAEVTAVPRFGSVAALRSALQSFLDDPRRFRPSAEARRQVLERLFHAADGKAASRVASLALRFIRSLPDGPRAGVAPAAEVQTGGGSISLVKRHGVPAERRR